jgi:hypothetical protein
MSDIRGTIKDKLEVVFGIQLVDKNCSELIGVLTPEGV